MSTPTSWAQIVCHRIYDRVRLSRPTWKTCGPSTAGRAPLAAGGHGAVLQAPWASPGATLRAACSSGAPCRTGVDMPGVLQEGRGAQGVRGAGQRFPDRRERALPVLPHQLLHAHRRAAHRGHPACWPRTCEEMIQVRRESQWKHEQKKRVIFSADPAHGHLYPGQLPGGLEELGPPAGRLRLRLRPGGPARHHRAPGARPPCARTCWRPTPCCWPCGIDLEQEHVLHPKPCARRTPSWPGCSTATPSSASSPA